MKRIFILCLLVVPSLAAAASGPFKLVNRNYGNASAYQEQMDPIFNALEDLVNKILPSSDSGVFLQRMSNAAVMSGAGINADYGSTFDYFMIGAGGGIGVEGGSASSNFTLNSIGGVGAQAEVFVGMPMKTFTSSPIFGKLDADKTNIYLGYLGLEMTQSDVSFKYTSFSLLMQYRTHDRAYGFYRGLKWGGVDVTTGIRYTSMKVLFTQKVTQTVDQTGFDADGAGPLPSTTMHATYDGTIKGGADIGVTTIPIEVSTSGRLLWVLAAYVGVGVDLNFGGATSIASISGPVTITADDPAYGAMGAEGIVDFGDSGKPKVANMRSFVGAQMEFGVLAMYIQTNRGIGSTQSGFSAGLKAYF